MTIRMHEHEVPSWPGRVVGVARAIGAVQHAAQQVQVQGGSALATARSQQRQRHNESIGTEPFLLQDSTSLLSRSSRKQRTSQAEEPLHAWDGIGTGTGRARRR